MTENTGILERAKNKLRSFVFMEPERPRLEEIDEKRIANAILTYLGRTTYPDPNRWADYDFTITLVLDKMGFESLRVLNGVDYYETMYPEYIATRKVLSSLVSQKVLGLFETDNEDDKETTVYEVLDEKRLAEIATSPS